MRIIIPLVLALVLTVTDAFAVTLDTTTAHAKNASGTTLTRSHTVTASGGNRALFLFCGIRNLSITLTATYAGEAMTEVRRAQSGSANIASWVFKKLAPATGANDWVVTQSSAVNMDCYAASVTNAEQTTGLTDDDGLCAADATPELTLTTGANDLLFDVAAVPGLTSSTEGANQTEILDAQNINMTTTGTRQAGADGGVMSLTWAVGDHQCHIAISVAHSAFSSRRPVAPLVFQ